MELYEYPVNYRVYFLTGKFPRSIYEARARTRDALRMLDKHSSKLWSIFDTETELIFWVGVMYKYEAKIQGNLSAVLWNKFVDQRLNLIF